MLPTSSEKQKANLNATLLKKEKDNELFNSTLKEFGEILKNEMNPVTLQKASQPLFRACQILGNIFQINFQWPSSTKTTNLADRLHEIALYSEANYRNILLPTNWWKEDHGPMLGFIYEESKIDQKNSTQILKPVVFIPEYNGHYSLIDPEDPIPKKITPELVARIAPSAMIFYRSFPDKEKLDTQDILRFCLHGRKRDLWMVFLVSLIAMGLNLFLPVANQVLFDYVIPYRDYQLFGQLLFGLILIFLSSAAFAYIKEYAVLKIETFLNHDMETALWDRLLKLPARFFRKYTVGDMLQRIFCVTNIRRILAGQVVRMTLNALFSCVYLGLMFYYSPSLSAIGLTFLLLGLLITIFGYFAVKKRAMQYLIGVISGKVIQMIMGLSKIRTNGAEKRFFRFWANDAIINQRLHLQMGTISNRIHTADIILDNSKYFVIYLVMIGWIAAETLSATPMLSLGAYLAFNIALVNLASSLSEFNGVILDMPSVVAMWKYAKVFLNEPLENSPNAIKPKKFQGAIHIDHLSFRYDLNGPWLHDNLSIHAEPGEFIGIVGPSGSGKSSLIRLLLGFEKPEQGAIYYDGQDLSILNLTDVRSQISTILQNSKIMDGNIKDNITAGNPHHLDEIMAAVKMAGFDDDLQQFPMGLQTVLTSGGTTISGGQKQRLFLARAFLSQSTIMLWDEATAGIDNNKQDIVIKNLEKLKATRIIIAHHLTTVKHADRIYVLDKGKIVESGTFSELAERKGLFSEMLARQIL